MRPNDTDIESSVYECFVCGLRTTDPEADTCPSCGSELNNISKPRDL
jgi:rubrerythrin